MRAFVNAATGRSTRGRVVGLVGGYVTGLVILLAVAGPAAAAQPWGFEQLTPVDKGAGTVSYVDTFQTAPDGESFLYTTSAPFDSIPSESSPQYTRYLGIRGPEQWNNIPLDPPYDTGTGSGVAYNIQGVIASSNNLRYAVVASPVAMTPGATEGGGNIYLRDTHTRELTLVATSPYRVLSAQLQNPQGELSIQYVGGEGKSVLFSHRGAVGGRMRRRAANRPDFNGFAASYKWTPENGVEAVTVLPESEGGEVVAGYPGGYPGENSTRLAMPETGGAHHIYWGRISQQGYGGVYVRTGDETKPVSYSRLPGASTEPAPAQVDGISRDGEYMVFQTTPFTPGLTEDTPESPNQEFGPTVFVYRYHFSDESLDYVGTTQSYGTAGVIQMSQDGQTIAFQSSLAESEGAEEGKPNYYIWRNGERQFVATVEPGSASASIGSSRQILSANGRYFTFTANAKGLAEKFDQNDLSERLSAGVHVRTRALRGGVRLRQRGHRRPVAVRLMPRPRSATVGPRRRRAEQQQQHSCG